MLNEVPVDPQNDRELESLQIRLGEEAREEMKKLRFSEHPEIDHPHCLTASVSKPKPKQEEKGDA